MTSRRPAKRRTSAQIEAELMEQARDKLAEIIARVRKHKAVTPEAVALLSSVLMTMAMLEREIGRRLTGVLHDYEISRDPTDNL